MTFQTSWIRKKEGTDEILRSFKLKTRNEHYHLKLDDSPTLQNNTHTTIQLTINVKWQIQWCEFFPNTHPGVNNKKVLRKCKSANNQIFYCFVKLPKLPRTMHPSPCKTVCSTPKHSIQLLLCVHAISGSSIFHKAQRHTC